MSRSRRCSPWRDWSCEVMRVESVPAATSRISRSKCSTPISSASSASIVEGVCTKVLVVVVPSYQTLAKKSILQPFGRKYIFYFLDSKVCIRRNANFLRLYVDDNEERVRCVALEELVDLKIGGA